MTDRLKFICPVDDTCFAETAHRLTAKEYNEYKMLLLQIAAGDDDPKRQTEYADRLKALYEQLFDRLVLTDVDGKKYEGVAACFEALDEGNLDVAVSHWFTLLPQVFFTERQRLGLPKRGN